MSGDDDRPLRAAEPVLRPEDPLWKWDGFCWARMPHLRGGVFLLTLRPDPSRGFAVSAMRLRGASMNCDVQGPIELAAAVAMRLCDYVQHLETELQTNLVIPRELTKKEGTEHVGRG